MSNICFIFVENSLNLANCTFLQGYLPTTNRASFTSQKWLFKALSILRRKQTTLRLSAFYIKHFFALLRLSKSIFTSIIGCSIF